MTHSSFINSFINLVNSHHFRCYVMIQKYKDDITQWEKSYGNREKEKTLLVPGQGT